MSTLIHHVPGRVRVRSPKLKRNRAEADRLCHTLTREDGVLAARANVVTGSITVHYDRNTLDVDVILELLSTNGHLATDAHADAILPAKSSGNKLAEKVLATLVEKLVTSAALAAVSAIA